MAASSDRGLPSLPLRAPLSARYQNTFAYPTMKDRCPVILCKVIDHLHRERNTLGRRLGREAGEAVAAVVGELSKLRYEMQTDKPITEISDGGADAEDWNLQLAAARETEGRPSWFSSAWLWVECYLYRRLAQALALAPAPQLTTLDCFQQQKEEGFEGSVGAMELLANWLLPHLKQEAPQEAGPQPPELWSQLLQLALWANKCDLSLSAGSRAVAEGDPVAALASLRPRLLTEESGPAWSSYTAASTPRSVDLVLDNAGFELFADLCLADWLVTVGGAGRVRIRCKARPWFVSDVTPRDLEWSLARLERAEQPGLARLAARWSAHLQSGAWTPHQDQFWTLGRPYRDMLARDPRLYTELATASLIVFKGDLNYRKLVGDLNWETTVPFPTALQEFQAAPVLAVRTAKADVMVGLQPGQAENITKQDPDWMVNGQWGVIQHAGRPN